MRTSCASGARPGAARRGSSGSRARTTSSRTATSSTSGSRSERGRSTRGGDAAGVHRAPHVEVVLRILADRRAGAVDGLVRPPLPGLLARRFVVEGGHLVPVARRRTREELVAAGVALVPHLGRPLVVRPRRAGARSPRRGRGGGGHRGWRR